MARGKANVICVVIGLSNKTPDKKLIYSDDGVTYADFINPYLSSSKTTYIQKRSSPISNLPPMVLGNMPKDGGFLFLTNEEKLELTQEYPSSKKYIKKALGSKEFLNGILQFCIWVKDEDYAEANKIPPLKHRFQLVADMRKASRKKATQAYSKYPYRFVEVRHKNTPSIIIPRVSSEKRDYIPIGFLAKNIVIKDLAYAIYNPEPYVFGVLSSRMHMIWVKAVGGKLKSDIRYSSALCYNNFPWAEISDKQKEHITLAVFEIIEQREKYAEKTMAELYSPADMPKDLRNAHEKLDLLIEKCYQAQPFRNDDDRLSCMHYSCKYLLMKHIYLR